MPTAVVIWNPISGRGLRQRALEELQQSLSQAGWALVSRPTAHAGHARELAAEAGREACDVVVAAGGDGTLNEVASGVLSVADATTRVAALPCGTSNLVAREFGLPFDAAGAARTIVEGRSRRVDVVSAGEGLFIACAGVGWDAHVVAAIARARRGHISFATYVLPSLRATLQYEFPPFSVTTAEGEQYEANTLLALNTRPYAAFFRPLPDARPDDGLLDLVLLRGRRRSRVAAWMYRSWRGTLADAPDAVHVRTTGLRIESSVPVPVQVDGDVGGTTPLDMLVRPRALELVVPSSAEQAH